MIQFFRTVQEVQKKTDAYYGRYARVAIRERRRHQLKWRQEIIYSGVKGGKKLFILNFEFSPF